MKAAQLQAQFIRKREIEQQKIQETESKGLFKDLHKRLYLIFLFFQDIRKYYDRWGKITSHHEHWSSPEFYREAEKKLEHQKEAENKQKELEDRKQRSRDKLAEEKKQFEQELKRKNSISNK